MGGISGNFIPFNLAALDRVVNLYDLWLPNDAAAGQVRL
jgi:hypothetical protein